MQTQNETRGAGCCTRLSRQIACFGQSKHFAGEMIFSGRTAIFDVVRKIS